MPAQPATLAALLDELYQKQRVLAGWTAVLSLSETSAQRLISQQWPASPQLSVEWVEPGESAVLDITLGPPSFGLSDEGEAVTFSQPVTAATLQRASGPPATIALAPGAAIEGTVALQLRAADDEPATSIALDLANATVSCQGLELASAPADLGARIASALAGDQPYPPLVSLDLSPDPGSAPTALQPSSLQHNVTVTPSGNRVLQFLIGGPDGAPADATIDVTEPVPTADGCDYSLLVESGVVIQDIVTAYNAQTGLVKLVAVNPDPAAGATAAYAQTRNPMQFHGKISCGQAITPIVSYAAMGMNFKGSTTDGLVVSGYALPEGNISLQLAVAGSFPLQLSPAGDLKLSAAASTSVTANGVAENNVKPRLQSFLSDDISPNMNSVALPAPGDLLRRRLSLPGLQPQIAHAQIPADLLLAGTLAPLPPS
jgi:hypothetical protein